MGFPERPLNLIILTFLLVYLAFSLILRKFVISYDDFFRERAGDAYFDYHMTIRRRGIPEKCHVIDKIWNVT